MQLWSNSRTRVHQMLRYMHFLRASQLLVRLQHVLKSSHADDVHLMPSHSTDAAACSTDDSWNVCHAAMTVWHSLMCVLLCSEIHLSIRVHGLNQ